MGHVSINEQNMPNLISRHDKSTHNVESQLKLEAEVYHEKLVEVTNESQEYSSAAREKELVSGR